MGDLVPVGNQLAADDHPTPPFPRLRHIDFTQKSGKEVVKMFLSMKNGWELDIENKKASKLKITTALSTARSKHSKLQAAFNAPGKSNFTVVNTADLQESAERLAELEKTWKLAVNSFIDIRREIKLAIAVVKEMERDALNRKTEKFGLRYNLQAALDEAVAQDLIEQLDELRTQYMYLQQ